MNNRGQHNISLWNEEDGFYYDVLHLHDDGDDFPLKVRSMVGLIPLFAVLTIEPEMLEKLPNFKRRLDWFIENRKDLTNDVACMRTPGSRRTPAFGDRLPRAARTSFESDARRNGISLALRHPLPCRNFTRKIRIF